MRKLDAFKLQEVFGLGIDFARADLTDYRWWEFEIHLTIGFYYITVRINHV